MLFVIYIDTIAYVASQSMAPEIINEYNISGILEHPLRILVRDCAPGRAAEPRPSATDDPADGALSVCAVGVVAAAELTLAASFALYVAARWFDWNFRVYPDQEWTFNPFCWQMLMVLGGWFAVRRLRPRAARHVLAAALAGAYPFRDGGHADAPFARWPPICRISFNSISPTDKENLAPYRVIHFLALAFLATSVWPIIPACN